MATRVFSDEELEALRSFPDDRQGRVPLGGLAGGGDPPIRGIAGAGRCRLRQNSDDPGIAKPTGL